MGYFLATAFKQRWQLPNRGRLRKWCFVSFVEKIYFFFPVELFSLFFSLFGFPEIMLTKGNFISFVGKFNLWKNSISSLIFLQFRGTVSTLPKLVPSDSLLLWRDCQGGGQDQAGNTAPNWWYFKFRSATLYLTKKEKDCLCSKVD